MKPLALRTAEVKSLIETGEAVVLRRMKPQPPEWCCQLEVGLYAPIVVGRDGEQRPGKEVFGASTLDGDWAVKCPWPPGTMRVVFDANDRPECKVVINTVTVLRVDDVWHWRYECRRVGE